MAAKLKLMCVLAHPDDETLGLGGTLAKYSAEGVETSVLTATRGERGWWGAPDEYPGLEALGRIREAELRAAAGALGVGEVGLLDYVDGELDQADAVEAIGQIAGHLRRARPHVVITFGPEGAYGHPDHIAISQFTTAAVLCAVDPAFETPGGDPPHRVLKLYYVVDGRKMLEAFPEIFAGIEMTIDGQVRRTVAWEEWAITTRIDARAYGLRAWEAFAHHQSQVPSVGSAAGLTEADYGELFGNQEFYRAYSAVNGGRNVEIDLFEGIR